MSELKLVYSQITSEPPLVAGETVTLFLVVTNPPSAAPVTVTGFEMVVPPSGSDADELSDHVAKIVPVGPNGWQATPQGRSFLFTPPGRSFAVEPDCSLTLQLTQVEVNNMPGPVKVTIFEGTPDAPQVKRDITKAPPGFVVGPLTANPVNSVDYPGSTTLSWVGSDDPQFSPSYTLQWIQHGHPITKKNLLAVEPGFPVTDLKDPVTAFTLFVDYTVNEQPHCLQRHASLSVSVPPPQVISFTATPSLIPAGDSGTAVTLEWDVAHAASVKINPRPGDDVPGTSAVVHPAASTLYELTAAQLPGYSGPAATAQVDVVTYTVVAEIPVGLGPSSIAASLDGRLVYVSAAGSVTVIDATRVAIVTKISLGDVAGGWVAVSHDGTKFYANSLTNGASWVFEAATNKKVDAPGAPCCGAIVTAPNGFVWGSFQQFNMNPKVSFVAGVNGGSNGSTPFYIEIPGPGPPWAAAMTPDGARLYVTTLDPSSVVVVDPVARKVVTSISVPGVSQGLSITPDGKQLYATRRDANAVSVIDTAENTVIASVSVQPSPVPVATAANGKWVYVGGGRETGWVSVIDVATHRVMGTIPYPYPVGALAAAPDRARLYVGRFGDTVQVIDLSD